MFAWFLRWIAPALIYSFRCVLCGVVSLLTSAAAAELGWKQQKGGWCCPGCAGK